MPSWGIHLGIANKLSQKIENIDKNLFMFGNVVPDINNGYVVEDISKIIPHKITHYDGEKDFKIYKKCKKSCCIRKLNTFDDRLLL